MQKQFVKEAKVEEEGGGVETDNKYGEQNEEEGVEDKDAVEEESQKAKVVEETKEEEENQQPNESTRRFSHRDSQLHLLLEARTLSTSQGLNTKHLSSVFYDLVP